MLLYTPRSADANALTRAQAGLQQQQQQQHQLVNACGLAFC